MKIGNAGNIPHFIKTKTPEQLQKAMLQNNLNNKLEIQYFSIQFVNGFWFAWFYKPVDIITKVIGGRNEQ